jgi:phosphoribosylformylglycinamidine cyclo-ligase
MCVNDIIVTGAEPLFFLDYYATGKLDVDVAVDVVKGIAKGCELSGAALTGGETAEMPGMYDEDDYDLAGFCVGIVEKSRIIEAGRVKPGNALIGMASSGPHSNGYSLIRKVLEVTKSDLKQPLAETTLGDALLAPTRIYVKPLLELHNKIEIHALAHITGGGLPENLPRVLPDGTRAIIDAKSWERPELFNWLQKMGNIEEREMLRTFNCGVGMVLCVAEHDLDLALETLTKSGEKVWRLGHIEESAGSAEVVISK